MFVAYTKVMTYLKVVENHVETETEVHKLPAIGLPITK